MTVVSTPRQSDCFIKLISDSFHSPSLSVEIRLTSLERIEMKMKCERPLSERFVRSFMSFNVIKDIRFCLKLFKE